MSTIDGRPMLYELSLKQLRALMAGRGPTAADIVQEYGGSEEICRKLHSDAQRGLSGDSADIQHRRELFGSNIIPPKPTETYFKFVWKALQDATLILLLIFAFISLGLTVYVTIHLDENEKKEGWIPGITIFSVMLVVTVTASSNYTKQRIFRNVQIEISREKLFSVIRHGELQQINVEDIVVGDIIQVEYGDLLPADSILLQSSDLTVDESSLTDESQPVFKSFQLNPLLFSG
ncbi:hypothetical protein HAZT_HAZT006047, partial [Hyalella azteca]